MMPQDQDHGPIEYVDSHVHLDAYPDAEVSALVVRARAAGVREMLTVGVDAGSSERAAVLAARLPGVSAAAGLHPLRLRRDRLARELEGVEAVVRTRRDVVAAVGEIGLDHSGPVGAALQTEAFAAQLALAARASLPAVVHSVGDHARTAAALTLAHPAPPAVIIHYFMGDPAELRRFLSLGCFISFGRPILKPGSETLRTAARLVPAEYLLVETDTYPLPGRTTEPRNVVEVVAALADIRGEPPAVVAAQTAANYRRALGRRA